MVMPSLICDGVVLHRSAARLPDAFGDVYRQRSRSLKLHGMVPIQVFAIPMIGFFMFLVGEAMAFSGGACRGAVLALRDGVTISASHRVNNQCKPQPER